MTGNRREIDAKRAMEQREAMSQKRDEEKSAFIPQLNIYKDPSDSDRIKPSVFMKPVVPSVYVDPYDMPVQMPVYEKQEPAASGVVDNKGVKFDKDKPPLHLLPFDSLEAIAKVLAVGAEKYGDRNWERGMHWHRCFRAATGHLWDWWMKRGPDPETGLSHLAHAGCCILFLIAYEIRKVGIDNRP